MLRDITLGQYYPSDSVIHRLDARTKIIWTLVYIIELFVITDFIGFLITTALLAAVIVLSKVPAKYILKGLKPIFIIIIFTFILNLFMIKGGDVLWEWKIFEITEGGVYRACFMAVRLIYLIIGSSLLTFTTKPVNLTDGIEKLLKPLNRIKVPAHELAMMMTIALRFIPTLLEETDKIMKAQQARCADFETGNILVRAKKMIPILVPLFISAFRIAIELAMAMEARCYRGGGNRTKMNENRFMRTDVFASIIMLLFTSVLIVLRFMQF